MPAPTAPVLSVVHGDVYSGTVHPTGDMHYVARWTHDSANVTSYRLYRCVGAGCSDFSLIVSLSPSSGPRTYQWPLGLLSEDTVYSVRVDALGVDGTTLSNIVTFRTGKTVSYTLMAGSSIHHGYIQEPPPSSPSPPPSAPYGTPPWGPTGGIYWDDQYDTPKTSTYDLMLPGDFSLPVGAKVVNVDMGACAQYGTDPTVTVPPTSTYQHVYARNQDIRFSFGPPDWVTRDGGSFIGWFYSACSGANPCCEDPLGGSSGVLFKPFSASPFGSDYDSTGALVLVTTGVAVTEADLKSFVFGWSTSTYNKTSKWEMDVFNNVHKYLDSVGQMTVSNVTVHITYFLPTDSEPAIVTPTVTTCEDSGDLGAASRGGWLKALLVDTGGAEVALSDYPAPTGVTATVVAGEFAAPTLGGVLSSGGGGAIGQPVWYAAATVHESGRLSELSTIIGPFTPDGVNRRVVLTFSGLADGASAVRVYRGTDPEFLQFARYRVDGYPYSESDVPVGITHITDEYPAIDTRTQLDPDPHWDLNYRQQRYYQLSATYADGSTSPCSEFVMVALQPRNAPLTVRVNYAAPTGPSPITGYVMRRSSQTYHFEIGLDRQWNVGAGVLSIDDPNNDTTATSPCATASIAAPVGSRPRYCLAGHWLKAVNEVFVLKPDPSSETNEFVQTLMIEGVDYVQEVVEVNGNRYHTLVFMEQQRSSTCQYYDVTANVEGVEYNADGTGALMTNADDIFEHMMLNLVLNTYRSSVGPYAPSGGRWYMDVPYAPGLLNHASVLTARAVGSTRVSGGYTGAGALTEPIGVREFILQLLQSYGLELYQFMGVWYVQRFQPSAIDRASALSINPDTGITAGTFTPSIEQNKHVNVIPYFAGPLSGTNSNGGYLVAGEMRDDASIDLYNRVIVTDPYYLRWTQDAKTAYSVVYHQLRQWRYPPINAQFEGPIRWFGTPVGTPTRVTHPDGLGGSGWVDRLCRILRVDLNVDGLSSIVTVRDIDDLVP